MKSIILSSVAVALIMFTGCNNDPKPATDSKKLAQETNVEEVQGVKTETVSTKDSIVNGSETTTINSESSKLSGTDLDTNSLDSLKFATVYFDFDSFRVTEAMQANISNDVAAAKNVNVEYSIKLEGNCDEWGSDEYNFALGLKRANAIKKTLVADGIKAENISMVSYGESNPVCNDKTQSCWAKNRRVDFTIVK